MGVVIADVSGHGLGPALLMSSTRAYLRALAQTCSDVGDILTRANRLLATDTGDFRFVTLAMARINPRDRTFVYASSGQRGYLLGEGDRMTILDSTSLPLGVQDEMTVPASPPITLQSGNIVTFFTDGVFEAESPGKVRFGAERALKVIRSERSKPARAIVDALYQDIAGFSRHETQRDDITIVVIKVE